MPLRHQALAEALQVPEVTGQWCAPVVPPRQRKPGWVRPDDSCNIERQLQQRLNHDSDPHHHLQRKLRSDLSLWCDFHRNQDSDPRHQLLHLARLRSCLGSSLPR